MNKRRASAWAVVIAGLLLGCDGAASLTGGPQPNTGLPEVQMQIGTKTYTIEITRTQDERNTGMMHRPALDPGRGMLFSFPDDQVRTFWMKSVSFPLDILFLDAQGRVVSIRRMEAYDLRPTSSQRPMRHAIELLAGQAAESGVKVGDQIVVPEQQPPAAAPAP